MKMLKKIALAGALSLAMTGVHAAEKLKMATIAPGTSAYLTMTTFANLVNQNQDKYEFTVDATGAATKHQIEVAKGKLDYCMTSGSIYHFLKTGKAMYKKTKDSAKLAENLRLIMWFPYGQYHFIVHEDSGIKTLADLKGKKVFFGPPGGGAWAGGTAWLKAATGLDVKAGDVENVKASWSSAFQGFQDRQFDAYVNGGIAPFPQVEQLALTSKIRLLGMGKEEWTANETAQKYTKSLIGRELGVIEKGLYSENVMMDNDIYTNASNVGIAVRADMPEEQVYEVTKAFWNNMKKAQESTPWLSSITMDYAVKASGMKLHAGAQKYYKEVGQEIPEGSMAN